MARPFLYPRMKNQMPSMQNAVVRASITAMGIVGDCVMRYIPTESSQNQKWLKMWVIT